MDITEDHSAADREGVSRVAVIAGGGGAIGQAIALGLASEGVSIGVIDIDADAAQKTTEMIRAGGGRAVSVRADLADAEQVRAAIAKVTSTLGSPYILVLAAGIYPRTAVVEMELEEWRKVLDTNLLSAFLICREVIPLMAAEGGGRVVAITSGLGSTGVARGAHYAASKAGLDALMRSLAEEVVEQGINVNCIAPGITDTPMMRRANRPEDVTAITERLPRRRLGAPQDMVPLVLFLVGVGAEHITGQVYSLRGTVR